MSAQDTDDSGVVLDQEQLDRTLNETCDALVVIGSALVNIAEALRTPQQVELTNKTITRLARRIATHQDRTARRQP